jgi:hypothetical protein
MRGSERVVVADGGVERHQTSWDVRKGCVLDLVVDSGVAGANGAQ